MGIVYGVGINDMERGWMSASEWNCRIYQVWVSMLRRCYDEKYHERKPTYKDCYCCERWLYLSNFVNDIVKIDGYEYWLNHPKQGISLDKDIKSNGTNKCYCLEQCMFVSNEENARQSNKNMDYDFMKKRTGENSPNLGSLIDRFDLQGNLIDTKYNFEYVQMGFNKGNISNCCRGRIKSTGGYVFKYHEEVK